MELAVATKAETSKNNKYKGVARREGATFVPFVVETFGGVGKQASSFIKTTVKLAGDLKYRWAPSEVLYGLNEVVAAATLRGNAAAVAASLRDR